MLIQKADRTYRAITVNHSAYLHSLAVMVNRKPLRIGGICRLNLISSVDQQSTLSMYYENMTP